MERGIRISAPGIDVKTGADKDMVLTSKYPVLKGTISGSGNISIPKDSVGHSVTIPHGLGYIPMVQAFARDRDGDYFHPVYMQMSLYDIAGSVEVFWNTIVDDENLTLLWFYTGGGENVDINYTYYIYLDKAKL